MLFSLVKRGHSVECVFSPSHCGIPRNEAADEKATTAQSLPQEGGPIWHVDFLAAVKRLYWKEVQEGEEAAHTARRGLVGVKEKNKKHSWCPGRHRASNHDFVRGCIATPAHSSTGLHAPCGSQGTLHVGGAVPPSLKRQDRPDLLRNLHLACRLQLFGE
ncbi:hypothetical protein TcCL_NonESM02409 [Trypanosoma cruzi]|nr:hypothetical protein TcCL_NonESM02409 [Trypanosoma cruzi]